MSWKDWPYWLKGGICGLGIGLIGLFFLLLGNIGIIPINPLSQTPWTSIIAWIGAVISAYTIGSLLRMQEGFFFIGIFISPIIYFIIGALIGLIIDKIGFDKKKVKYFFISLLFILILVFIILLIKSFFYDANIANKNNNFFDEGVKNLDSSFCKQITVAWQSKGCLEKVAMKSGDVSYCDNIPIEYIAERTICYEGVANTKNDPSICNKLGDYADECLRDYKTVFDNWK